MLAYAYPGPVPYAGSAAPLYGDVSWQSGNWDAWYAMAYYSMQPMQDCDASGMVHDSAATPVEETVVCPPGLTSDILPHSKSKSKSSKKKRRNRGSGQTSESSGTQVPSGHGPACVPLAHSNWRVASNQNKPAGFTFCADTSDVKVASIVASWGSADELAKNFEHCAQIITLLEARGSVAHSVFTAFLPATMTLAMSKHGTRVIQKAIEVVEGQNQSLLLQAFEGHIVELQRDDHGNHVIAKMIEVMPPSNLGFVLLEFSGMGLSLARHQYGCRLFERLIEHFKPDVVAGLVGETLSDAEALSRHQYGNFVVQHIFEHGIAEWKMKVTEQIIDKVPFLAQHRTASHVVQNALEFGGPEIQGMVVSALMRGEGENSLADVACKRYGSFVVEELASLQPYFKEVHDLLQLSLPRINAMDIESKNGYGKRAVAKFGLVPAA